MTRQVAITTILLFWCLVSLAHAQLAPNSERLAPELQTHGSIAFLIDPENGRIIDANKAAVDFYGYDLGTLRRMRIQEINMLAPAEVEAEFMRARAEERNYFIFPHQLANGTIRTVEVYSSPFIGSSGKPLLLSIIHDATEKFVAEEELLRYKTRLEELVAEQSKQLVQWYVFSKWMTIIGVSFVFGLALVLFRKNQQYQLYKERCRREEERKSFLERFEYLNRYANDIILLVDEEGRIIEANGRAVEMYGYSLDELLRMNIKDLHDQQHSPPYKSVQNSTLLHNGHVYEALHVREDGSRFPIESSARLVRIHEKTYFQHIIRDITERKQAEKALLQAKEQAEAANQTKSEFLANMSHEIRTPLNGIMGMMQLMETTTLNADQKQFVQLAIVSANRLTRLLSDILDLSRIEAGKVEIIEAEFVVQELGDSLSDLFKVTARDKGVHLECSIDPKIPSRLVGDEARVRQILFNLVGNALKFTKQGHVKLEMTSLGIGKDHVFNVLFTVSDTGIGIPDDKLITLFKPFVQVQSSYTRSFQGAGLGLAIVKRLVDLMGGNISVDSVVGEGTAIYVVLPFKLPAGESAPELKKTGQLREAQHKLRILLAEDDPSNSLPIMKLLEKAGHKATLAEDGQQVLDKLAAQDFDVILMDVQMPVMNGLEATKMIRRLEKDAGMREFGNAGIEQTGKNAGMREPSIPASQHPSIPASQHPSISTSQHPSISASSHPGVPASRHSRIPIIALTAFAMTGDREKFLESGMDDYLAKPVRMEDLQKVLEKHSSKERQQHNPNNMGSK